MVKHYVMSPVHSYFLLRQLIETPPGACEATSFESLTREVTNWRDEELGLGYKPESIALVCGAGLKRYLEIQASPDGWEYDFVVISDSPEFLYRFLRQTQNVDMEVDLWIDQNTENWRDFCKKPVNDDNTSSKDIMFGTHIADLIRDNIGRELKRLPRLVQFPNYNDEFGNYAKDVMEQAQAIQQVLQKR